MSSTSSAPTMHEAPVTLSVAHCLDEIDHNPIHRAHTAYIVVDVIRATTTLAVMFEQGVRRVLVARDVAAARNAHPSQPKAILAGEVNAMAPADFDHGNSPDEWGRLDLTGSEILFSTTNGARGLHAAMGGGPVFAGALRNASAVCADALEVARHLATAERHGALTIVCAGLGGRPADDDSLCAGWLIQTAQSVAAQAGVTARLGPGAQQALELLAASRRAHDPSGDALPALWLAAALTDTPAARGVWEVGLGADIAWCADVDASTAVPMVAGEDVSRTLLIVERAPADVSSAPLGEELR
ncbi:MAG TPA: 2-phosphosulfolactate phosphatase [Ktedonobacterales bacterium]